jgi:flagellar basal body-associated protein FliL
MKICKTCGQENENHFNHCFQCGGGEFALGAGKFAAPPIPPTKHSMPALPQQSPSVSAENKPHQSGGSLFIKICLGLIAVFLLLVVIGMIVGGNSSSDGSSGQQAQEARQQAQIRSAIETVLQQDAGTTTGVNSVAEVVNRMRAIDMSGCPNDFRAAYLGNIHAWEAMADVEQQAIQLKKEGDSSGAYVEAFVRGFMGDPFGKVKDEMQAQNQLQQNANSAKQQIQQTFNQVEEIAVAYGANLPKK